MGEGMGPIIVDKLSVKLLSGIGKAGGMSAEVKRECLDILHELLKRFGHLCEAQHHGYIGMSPYIIYHIPYTIYYTLYIIHHTPYVLFRCPGGPAEERQTLPEEESHLLHRYVATYIHLPYKHTYMPLHTHNHSRTHIFLAALSVVLSDALLTSLVTSLLQHIHSLPPSSPATAPYIQSVGSMSRLVGHRLGK
ncbi:hypothetical protein EON63_13045 [archaeon]|nr:MAG: hypothetical protein EON63_13045 [archaeon]